MAGEWKTRKLGECCDFNPASIKADWPHPSLRYIDISSVGEGIQSEPFKLIPRSEAPSRAQRLVAPGDCLLSTVRPSRRSMLWLGSVDENVVASTGFAVLRAKPGVIFPRYLYYTVFNKAFTDHLVTREKGAAYPAVSTADIGDADIELPPLAEQKAIAEILGTMDDKIELNWRMNETLEAMAQSLFKSWFVDATLATLSACPAQAGLPKGWREGTLGDVAENPRRGVQPDEIKPSTPYIGLEHMPRRCIALSEWEHADELESNKFEFKRGEILFGKLRPYFHKVGVAPLDGVCSTDILVVTPKEPAWFGFVLGHVSSVELVNHTDAASTGTKMPRTNWSDIARYEVALPPEALAAKFSELIQPLIGQIIANIHESRTLAALRDALLPKLLSGELRVPAAAKLVENRA